MKIINKQCDYYMYLLIFEARAFLAGKSALVHKLSFERSCIGAAADLFSRESFNMNRGQQRMLFFFQLPRSLEDKLVTIILGTRVNKTILNIIKY